MQKDMFAKIKAIQCSRTSPFSPSKIIQASWFVEEFMQQKHTSNMCEP